MKTDPRLLEFARQMRHEPAPAEERMWKLLRHRRLAGFRFRRQQPIPPYIADYYCAVAKLVIELDGDSHGGLETSDLRRTEFLESQGLRVLRFLNHELFEDEDSVLETIYQACIDGVKSNPQVRHKLDAWGHFGPSPPTPLPSGETGEEN